MKVELYTDGSCIGNPGPGGWAAVLRCGDHKLSLSGGSPMTTNNAMELEALRQALLKIKKPCTVVAHSDSAYLVNNFSRVPLWKARGWMTTTGPVKNAEIWQDLCRLVSEKGIDLRLVHVKGHAGIPGNETVDAMARREAEARR